VPIATPDDLWIYIYRKNGVRARDLEQQFVQTKMMSRGTMYKYVRMLEMEGKVQAKPVPVRPPYHLYSVPPEKAKEAEAVQHYKQLTPHRGIQTQSLDWRNSPPGFYLTNAQEKTVWSDEYSGAVMTLIKLPVGLAETPHIHPDANQLFYALSGEMETPQGNTTTLNGYFLFTPRGTRESGIKITKECICLIYWDGPRKKIDVPMLGGIFTRSHK
jgi:hypothetical protein